MALVRHTVAALRKMQSRTDQRRLKATTEADVRRQMLAAGEDPDAPVADYLPPDLARIVREKLGMTQQEFAATIRVPVATVRNWEQMRVRPDPAAWSLLAVLLREPKAALRALGRKSA